MGLPVRDRVGDPLLVGHGRVDLVGHLAVGPAELAAGDDDGTLAAIPAHGGVGLLDLLDAAEIDVALEDRAASTTAYCTAFGPNVTPVMMAVPTSSELCSSGLSELLVFLDRDVLFFAALRLERCRP